MSISSSFYTGMSSFFCLGDKLGTLGDNLANVNTTGFRAGQVSFEDMLIEATNTGGVKLSPSGINSDFSEGTIQPSTISTNMAITGNGFFMLRDAQDSGATYYTRAGEFSFTADGYLVNPRGYVVQGYQIDSQGTVGTTLADIQLPLTTPQPTILNPDPVPRLVSPPTATTSLTLITNVDARSEEHSSSGLFGQWNATNTEPISVDAYELETSQEIFDDAGAKHTVSIFFDKTSLDNVWEYLITAPPAGLGATPTEGVLARGTITYNFDGIIEDMSLENYQGGAWAADTPNANGYFSFQTPFTGVTSVEINLGTKYVNGFWQRAGQTSTQYGYSSYTISSNTDGNGEGDLSLFSVSSDGVVQASFNNGVTSDLFQVGLANSNDPCSHFRRIGYSLYQATPEGAGAIITDTPGNSGLGKIMGSSLENSNVDMAAQFGDLIFTQRAFQANSKSITAADEMLKTLIALKS